MDDNKLYRALLKSQNEDDQARASRGEAKAEEGFRKERPYAARKTQEPNWVHVETGEDDHPPTVYDSSVTLSNISNPKPWTLEQLRQRKIIYPSMSEKKLVDAYRELRIQLKKRAGEERFTVMLSSLSRDDALQTAFNLSVALAMDPHTASLFVDCDPYHGRLQDLVSTRLSLGVTDYLADSSVKIKEIIYPSGIDRLSVIPAGTQASSAVELFASVRMRELMAELENRYPDRCIVLNAPSFNASTEAKLLERFCDQLVLSVPFGDVSQADLEDAIGSIESSKFAGLVFQE